MQPDNLIERIREHYVPQLADFIDRQRKALGRGAGEVKFDWGAGSLHYRNFSCIDFAAGGESPRFIEFGATRWLAFDPLTTTVARSLSMNITTMRWDNVRIEHDAARVDETRLSRWFEHWFDPEDSRYVQGAELGDIIHRITLEPWAIEVDFGSSRPDSFWGLVDVLHSSGASQLRVSFPGEK